MLCTFHYRVETWEALSLTLCLFGTIIYRSFFPRNIVEAALKTVSTVSPFNVVYFATYCVFLYQIKCAFQYQTQLELPKNVTSKHFNADTSSGHALAAVNTQKHI